MEKHIRHHDTDNTPYRLYKGAWVYNGNPGEELELSEDSAKRLLKNGGVLVRNVYDFDCASETDFWYVLKDSFDGMEELPSKVRNCVRRALKTYHIQIIYKEEFRRIARDIYNEAIGSYRVKAKTVSQSDIDEIAQMPFHEFWGVYRKDTGEAVAVARNMIFGDYCDYSTLKALPEALHNSTYPYYGLLYEMNRHYLQEKRMRYVCDGARTVTGHSNIQKFLVDKFNFRKAYCRLKIYYKPWMKLLVNVIYPFRKTMPNQVRGILNMEAMCRGEM